MIVLYTENILGISKTSGVSGFPRIGAFVSASAGHLGAQRGICARHLGAGIARGITYRGIWAGIVYRGNSAPDRGI